MNHLAPPIASFVERSKHYAAQAKLQPSTVSRKLFNDGKYLARLEAGGDIGVQTLREAEERLARLEHDLAEAQA